MFHKKLISIILPTYNGSRFIRDSIESIIKQTYKNWELIIVDDCSTDDTLTILKEYEKQDSRIHVISNLVNKKLPASLNVGFQYAKGEYWTWTSDDNIYKEDAIEYMTNYLNKNSDVDLLSCNFDIVTEDLVFICSKCDTYQRDVAQLAVENQVGACFMYTRNVANRIGEYDTSMFCAEDYDYWCRIAKVGKIAYDDGKSLYIYRQNSKSLTETKKNEVIEKTYSVWRKHSNDILNNVGYNTAKKCQIFFELYYRSGKNREWLELAKKEDFLYYLTKLVKRGISKITKNIFSIRNEGNKKIFRLLGFKIKIRKK